MLRGLTVAGAIAVIMVLVVGAGTANAASARCADASKATKGGSPAAQRAVLCVLNAERAKRGLRGLRLSAQLTRAARAHSTDMVANAFFGHIGSTGRTPAARVQGTGYRSTCKVDETLAYGTAQFSSPRQLVGMMLASNSHRKSLLGRSFREVGIGLVAGVPEPGVSGSGSTLTLNFARR